MSPQFHYWIITYLLINPTETEARISSKLLIREMSEENVKFILERIRKKRESLGYSQEYVAYKLGMTQKGYSKIELGITQLKLDEFLQICAILSIPAQELLNLN